MRQPGNLGERPELPLAAEAALGPCVREKRVARGDSRLLRLAPDRTPNDVQSCDHFAARNRAKAVSGSTPHAFTQAMNSVTSTRRFAVSQL